MQGTAWESRMFELFDDLEQQAAGLELAERDLEVADLSVTEYARIGLAARLRASVGRALVVTVAGGLQLRGSLTRSGEGWLMLRDGGADAGWLVPRDAVTGIAGLSPRAAAPAPGSVAERLPMRALLRRLAETAGACQVHLRDGSRRDGRLARVGEDFVELAPEEQRGRPGQEEASVLVVPGAALAAVRWSAW